MSTSSNWQKPSIFLSSTCYDLKQIRNDIKLCIEQQLGYTPLLSEFDTFPLDPSLGTVENCLRVVKERADIFILVVGGRYGFQTDSGKSVTNLEYLHAKEKGIPVYAFVSKSIIDMLPVWKDNPDGNFASVVDTTKLFEFVEELRGKDNVWVYNFETAQDIIRTLKTQLGYLFHNALQLRQKLQSKKLSDRILGLSPISLALVLEKPPAWEYRLFGQVLKEKCDELEELRRDVKFGVSFGNTIQLSAVSELAEWMAKKFNAMKQTARVLTDLINVALVEALGPPRVSADVEAMVYVAERVMGVYKYCIDCALEVRRVVSLDEGAKLIGMYEKVVIGVIRDIEEYCNKFYCQVAKIPELLATGRTDEILDCGFKLNWVLGGEFEAECERLAEINQ